MKKHIWVCIAGATMVVSAHAQGPYVGLGVANSDTEFQAQAANTVDGYKASAKIFGGYDIDDVWGVEAGYTELRKASGNFGGVVAGRATMEGHRYYVAVKETTALNEQFSVFGKLGVENDTTKVSTTPFFSFGADETRTGIYAGIGGQYNITKKVALTLEYERYGKTKKIGAKADAWTIGAKFHF